VHAGKPFSRLGIAALLTVLILAPNFSRARAETPQEERIHALEQQVQELRVEVESLRGQGLPAERLAELERRMDLLAQEIERLRIGEAASDGPLESRYGLGPAASKVYGRQKGVSIGGYGEGLYESRSGETDTADLLRAVFYFGYKWTDKILFNSEIEFEHATTGEGAEEKGEVSVEFAAVDFLLSGAANVRAGLVLIPVGFINELHEPTVFFGPRRPEVERVILPSTWREIGVGGFGDLGPVSWRAYLVAGLDAEEFRAGGIREGRQGGSQSKAEDLALTARTDWTVASGVLVGASVFAGNAGQDLRDLAGETIDARTVVWEGHAEWRWRALRLRGLAARGSVGDVARLNDTLGFTGAESIGSRQSGWYGEAALDLLGLFPEAREQSLVLYGRHEAYDTQREVPAEFDRNPANDVRVRTVGLDWKPIPNVVVKAAHQAFEDRANAPGAPGGRWSIGLGFIF